MLMYYCLAIMIAQCWLSSHLCMWDLVEILKIQFSTLPILLLALRWMPWDITDDKSTLVQDGLVPSGNKPFPKPMLSQIYMAIWPQWIKYLWRICANKSHRSIKNCQNYQNKTTCTFDGLYSSNYRTCDAEFPSFVRAALSQEMTSLTSPSQTLLGPRTGSSLEVILIFLKCITILFLHLKEFSSWIHTHWHIEWEQNDGHFVGDIVKYIFLNENDFS